MQQEMSFWKDQKGANQMPKVPKVESHGEGLFGKGEHMQQLRRHTQDRFVPSPK